VRQPLQLEQAQYKSKIKNHGNEESPNPKHQGIVILLNNHKA